MLGQCSLTLVLAHANRYGSQRFDWALVSIATLNGGESRKCTRVVVLVLGIGKHGHTACKVGCTSTVVSKRLLGGIVLVTPTSRLRLRR